MTRKKKRPRRSQLVFDDVIAKLEQKAFDFYRKHINFNTLSFVAIGIVAPLLSAWISYHSYRTYDDTYAKSLAMSCFPLIASLLPLSLLHYGSKNTENSFFLVKVAKNILLFTVNFCRKSLITCIVLLPYVLLSVVILEPRDWDSFDTDFSMVTILMVNAMIWSLAINPWLAAVYVRRRKLNSILTFILDPESENKSRTF